MRFLTVMKFADKTKLNKITLWHCHKQKVRKKCQKVKKNVYQTHISLSIFHVCCMWEKTRSALQGHKNEGKIISWLHVESLFSPLCKEYHYTVWDESDHNGGKNSTEE